MKRRLAWVMAAFLCVTSVPQGSFLSMAAEESSTEEESEGSSSFMEETEESSAEEEAAEPETMLVENVETETGVTEITAAEAPETAVSEAIETEAPETAASEAIETEAPETAASEAIETEAPETAAETTETEAPETAAAETTGFRTQEAETEEIAVLSEDEKPSLVDAKIELSADVNLKAGVNFTDEDITVTISYSDGRTWVMKQQPNCDETDPYGNYVAIEILDSEGNRLYGSIDKAGTYTLYVSVYVLGESDRRTLGKGLTIEVRENAATPFVLGAEEVLESGHNYRTFAPETSGYYWLEGVNMENPDIRDEAENEIGSIVAFGGENVVSAYYLEQGHTYRFDLQKKRSAGDSKATVRFAQVTEEWNYEEAGIQDEEPGAHYRLLRPKTSTSYVFSTRGASLVIKNSKGEDIFNDAGWEWTLHRSFELDAAQTYLVGTYAEPETGVYASLAKYRTLKNAELKYTWDACYLGFDGLFADRFQLKLTFDDGYETVLTDPEEEDIYGNSLRNMHFGEPGSTDENSRSMVRIVKQEVYEAKVYVNGNEIASTQVNCQPIDFDALPEIRENQEVEIKDPKIRQLYRYTADKNGQYYGDGVKLYTKTDTGWEWINPRYSTLKAGESYLVYFDKGEAGKVSFGINEVHEHTYKTVIDKKATCTEAGSQHEECTGCGDKKAATVIPATGHQFTTKIDKAATCGAAGSQHRECSVCGYKEAAIAIPATGKHTYITKVDKAATCGAAGSQHEECTVCGDKKAAIAIPATGKHTYITKVDKAATCGEAGSQHEECTVCGDKKAATTIPATGKHSFSAYRTTVAATVLKTGTKERTCTVCGEKETASIAKRKATIRLSAAKITVPLNKTIAGPTVTFGKGDAIKSWKSLKTSVVTVNSRTGKLTGKKAGTAKVTVTLKSGKKATVIVTVKKITTTKLKANRKAITLKKGKTFQIKVTVTPKNSQEKVAYKSSNTKIAIVTGKGKITAKKKGKAVITITSGKKKITCKVTVE